MKGDPRLASWLILRRRDIDRRMAARLGASAPGAATPEAEALRRFRSFACSALLRGEEAPPALDGLRVRVSRTQALVEAWVDAAAELAGPDAGALRGALEPLVRRFSAALRATTTARRASGAPRRSSRRAVSAAIDRLADVFLAIDAETLRIADANPAAGALLGLSRDRLLESDAMGFVPADHRSAWSTHIDAISEGSEPRRFQGHLCDVSGATVEVEASLTCFATRRRTLALVLARPRASSS